MEWNAFQNFNHILQTWFSEKSRYDRLFQKVTHEGGGSEMNYIKIFQYSQTLFVSVGNSYYEDQLMHILLDNFQQSWKYSAQIAIHQAELRREVKFIDQNSLSISYLQIDYLNIDSSSGSVINDIRDNIVQTKCTFCGGANHSTEKCFERIIKDKEKYRASGDPDKRRTELTPPKCFRYGPEYQLIAKCPKPSKDNKKQQKQVCFSEKDNHSSQK